MSKPNQGKNNFKDSEVTPKMCFGIKTELENCIQCINSEKFVFICGYYAVICRKKSQDATNLVPIEKNYGKLTAFACDEISDITILFFGQKKEDSINFIFKYINKAGTAEGKTKAFKFKNPNQEVVAANMNCKRNLLAALIGPSKEAEGQCTSANQNIIVLYNMEKTNPKKVGEITLTSNYIFKNLLICSFKENNLAAYGEGGFAIINTSSLTKTEYGLLEREKDKEKFMKCTFNIVSCAWVPENSVAFLNDNCDIIIFDYAQGQKYCHKALYKGFDIFETSSIGVSLFEKDKNLFVVRNDGYIVKLENKTTKENILFTKPTSATGNNDMKLPNMELKCLSAGARANKTDKSNFGLVMATKDKQIYKLEMNNDNAISDGTNFKHYLCSYHSDEINSLDVAHLKSTIATASKDKTVRIWNYLNYQLEVVQPFEDEPLKVSFHPNGLHLAVMFKQFVKCYDVFEDRLEFSKSLRLAPSPKDVKFSNYGSLLGVCSKSSIKIFNFFTDAILFDSSEIKSKYKDKDMISHTDDITAMAWDLDDTAIATCGIDGRVIYWDLNILKQTIKFQNREGGDFTTDSVAKYFRDVQIVTEKDLVTKHLLALNDFGILDIHLQNIGKDTNDREEKNETISDYIVKGKFSSIFYDFSSNILFYGLPMDQHFGLKVMQYDSKITIDVAASSKGILAFKPSPDLRSLFAGGRDGALFVFETKSFPQQNESKETETKEDIIITSKEYLDENAIKLRKELEEKDAAIAEEEKNFKVFNKRIDKEIEKEENEYKEKKKEFEDGLNENNRILEENKAKFNEQMRELREKHERELAELQQIKNIGIAQKEEDRKESEKALQAEKTKAQKEKNNQRQDQLRKENKLKEEHKNILEGLQDEINILKETLNKMDKEIEEDRAFKMSKNDEEIAKKRKELDDQKKKYEDAKEKHAQQTEELKTQINNHKETNKKRETSKTKLLSELNTKKQENMVLAKQIADLNADIEEKQRTITDKNELKKKLEKDNQELEKFKYVLHYKIKELKHNKEPKERKIQQMEKKAKDMEREIKNCELNQAKVIINLTTNHQIIKIHEEQITKTEMRINELRKYRRLFQESLYNSMRRAKNHKDCKKELVILKRNFLDKDKIDNIEKPFEANYELQRKFLEKNVNHYKDKIANVIKLFSSDHGKVMKEKRQLVEIVNQLKKEQKEIQGNDVKDTEVVNLDKPRIKAKDSIPKFAKKKQKTEANEMEEEDQEAELKKLAEELKDYEKKIQWYKYWDKKHKEDQKKKEKYGADEYEEEEENEKEEE